jgi:hypothetical protein
VECDHQQQDTDLQAHHQPDGH